MGNNLEKALIFKEIKKNKKIKIKMNNLKLKKKMKIKMIKRIKVILKGKIRIIVSIMAKNQKKKEKNSV